MAEKDFKTVATSVDPITAEILAERLRSAGIPAAAIGGSSPLPSFGITNPIEVKVNAEDYERAKTLLAAEESAE